MSVVKPFRGLLPVPEIVEKVAAVPYDVVNSEEAAELAKDNMLSFLRVARPEIEMDPGVNLYDDAVYEKAAANFKRLIEKAPLVQDEETHLYAYSLKMGDHVQVGILGLASTDDYDNDIIKKHEKTRQDKEDDRTRHVLTLRSHTGPVFLTYKDDADIDAAMADAQQEKPVFDFVAPDGIEHKLWRIDSALSATISEKFASNVPCLYVADGHHRAKAASRAAEKCRQDNPNHTGQEDYNFFLTVSFPASQLQILAYNRTVKDLHGLSADVLKSAIHDKFEVTETDNPVPQDSGQFCMYLEKQWYLLVPKFEVEALDVISKLDVSILQDNILAPLLGIDDPRTSKRVDFVGGIRGTAELEKLVDTGKAAVAFSMYPTTVQQLMDIADAGEIMPPKSTWFEPKLRDGMVCDSF